MNYDRLIYSPQPPTPFPEKKRYMSFIKKLVNNNFHYIKFIIKEILHLSIFAYMYENISSESSPYVTCIFAQFVLWRILSIQFSVAIS